MLSIYKSSAGSGKTFTLVKEYLKLCLPNPEKFRSIVAITFTNAASAEMKERIIDKLQGLANGGEDDLRGILLKEGITEAQLNNSGKVLGNILYNYSRFNISTIDSFFHKILRGFGKELGLPLDFEIFLETDEALDYAVDTFIQRSHTNRNIHNILLEYIREKISNGSSWIIRADLYRIAKELLEDATFLMATPELEQIQEFIKTLRSIISEFENTLDAIGKNAIQAMEYNGLEIADFKYGKTGPANYFNKIQKPAKEYEPGKRFLSALDDNSQWLNSAANRQAEETMNVTLIPLGEKAFRIYRAGHSQYISAKEILRNIYTFSVYEEIHKTLLEYKEKNEVVLISDFNRILSEHLIKEQISFIYSKIGVRYEHFLIDEFQDTSRLQWMNLRPLIENALSQNANCLIVGDSKQGIYRWRGGDVELIEKQVPEVDFAAYSQKISLNSNYRSRTEVVEFNNRFFTDVLRQFPNDFYERGMLDRIFSDVVQIPAAKNKEGGYVEITYIQKEGQARENFLLPAMEKLLETINSVLLGGHSLKDIAILVRDKRQAEEAARLLLANDINFISPDSLSLENVPSIRLLFSTLNYISDTRNNLAKTELLFTYLQYFNSENGDGFSASEVLMDFSNAESSLFNKLLPEEFTGHIFELAIKPLYELSEELIRIFGLQKEPDAYIQRFLEVTLEYSRKYKLSIRAFLDWWKENKYSIIMPDDIDAIRIMTIHKSKGLEFSVVIIPFADWNFRSSTPDIMWIEPEEEPFNKFEKLPVNASTRLLSSTFSETYKREEAMITIDNLNLLYVAFTRAKDKLYITTEKQKNDKEEINCISQLIFKVLKPDVNSPRTTLAFGKFEPVIKSEEGKLTTSINLKNYPVLRWNSILQKRLKTEA
jgi:ATP-dependent helicase/nuclease subunit A